MVDRHTHLDQKQPHIHQRPTSAPSPSHMTSPPESMWNDRERSFSVVLLGGGHSNTQVVNSINRSTVPSHIRLILVSDYGRAFYSGMVPGFVSGFYSEDEISLDLPALCKARGWEFVCSRVRAVNSKERKLVFEDESREPLSYDVLSVNCGSSTLGCSVPALTDNSNTTCTRPLSSLGCKLRAIDKHVFGIDDDEKGPSHSDSALSESNGVSDASSRGKVGKKRLVCVGGGAAGCEMAMALQTRWKNRCTSLEVMVIAKKFLGEREPAVQARLMRIMKKKGIQIMGECTVGEVKKKAVVCKDTGKSMEYDVLVWATGAQSHEFISQGSDLQVDAKGWIEVEPTLQSLSAPEVFAAGDCCTFPHLEKSPAKAGVYAVREGPFLIHNILAYLKGETLNKYVPQDDFLSLIMTGDGQALGAKFGFVFHGKFAWHLKDRIDRKWMGSFAVDRS